MYSIIINGFVATTKGNLEATAKEARVLKDSYFDAIIQIGWDGNVFSVEDAEAFVARSKEATN